MTSPIQEYVKEILIAQRDSRKIDESEDDLDADGYDIGHIGPGAEKGRPKHYVSFEDAKRVEDNLESAIREMIKITPMEEVVETLLEIAEEIKLGQFK